jgi:hypothetical protein
VAMAGSSKATPRSPKKIVTASDDMFPVRSLASMTSIDALDNKKYSRLIENEAYEVAIMANMFATKPRCRHKKRKISFPEIPHRPNPLHKILVSRRPGHQPTHG